MIKSCFQLLPFLLPGPLGSLQDPWVSLWAPQLKIIEHFPKNPEEKVLISVWEGLRGATSLKVFVFRDASCSKCSKTDHFHAIYE